MCRLEIGCVLVLSIWAGCGPAGPREVLEAPQGFPESFSGRRLYHTPQAYIYAHSDTAAGDADRWVIDAKSYIKSRYKGELAKGVVIVMEPEDPPLARTVDEQISYERDPAIMRTQPRKMKTAEEIRTKLNEDGIPELPAVRSNPIPLTAQRLQALGLAVPESPWAVAVPSHQLALNCAVEVGAPAFRKKAPKLTEEQSRKVAEMAKGTLSKAIEISIPMTVFELWVQSQSSMSDEQRRAAIHRCIPHFCHANGLPAPPEEEIDW